MLGKIASPCGRGSPISLSFRILTYITRVCWLADHFILLARCLLIRPCTKHETGSRLRTDVLGWWEWTPLVPLPSLFDAFVFRLDVFQFVDHIISKSKSCHAHYCLNSLKVSDEYLSLSLESSSSHSSLRSVWLRLQLYLLVFLLLVVWHRLQTCS